MRKLFIGVYNPSIILTYVGMISAILGIGVLITQKTLGAIDPIGLAMIALIVSGVCDMFDGAVARRCKRTEQEKQFGIQLDSLADTISFVVFPASMLIFIANFGPVSLLIACFYAFAGIMRLGWFNITTETSGGVYSGLPVTFSSVIFPTFYLALSFFEVPRLDIIFQVLTAVVGVLFITNFKTKKIGIKKLCFLLIPAIIGIVALILLKK
ncbi:MAG: CDP-alcohol phosphatidyltransferase family protein [Clostridia bacterium]|nr:CDP-alcohol phosphatidyltransferase family protein [Clostridia bacterium]